MLGCNILQAVIVFLNLAIITHQVDIRIERTWIIAGEPESFIAAICFNIRPGECCKPPMHYPDATTKVSFRHLVVWDIAAVWQDRSRLGPGIGHVTTGCSGPLLASRRGPGAWLWSQPSTSSINSLAAEGASYIRLPSILPPDPRVAYTLVIEGVLGLIWGRGRWFSNDATEKLLAAKYSVHVTKRARRDIRSSTRGYVYARAPSMLRHPDSLEVNGIMYTAKDVENFVYLDGNGNLLNLTDWTSRVGH